MSCLDVGRAVLARSEAEDPQVMEKKVRVEVSGGCIGVGLCLAIAPEQFQFADARTTSTTDLVGEAGAIELVRSAAAVCPVAAISVAEVEEQPAPELS